MTLLGYLHCNRSKSLAFRRFYPASKVAQKLFDGSSQRNATTSINHSISESLRRSSPAQALAIFKENLQLGFCNRNMDEITLCLALKACRGDPKRGCQIHGFSITSGFTSFFWVSNVIMGLSQGGNVGFEAVAVFRDIMREGVELDHVSFTSVITTCCHETHLKLVMQFHGLCIKRGFETLVEVGNNLMSSYSKCGVLEAVKVVFCQMSERNVISWTTMISSNKDVTVSIFHKIRLDGVSPNEVTFVALINAVKCNEQISDGLETHGLYIKTGFVLKLSVGNSFITIYAKFEALEDAKKAFDEINVREIISWNAMISGFAQNGFLHEALKMFLSAVAETVPNEYTFGSVLSAIASAVDISLMHGQRCHAHILKLGLNRCPVVSSALLDMYAKRGSINESEKVFNEMAERNQFVWTSMISAYSSHGDFESVMNYFQEMIKENVAPDLVTFLSVLTACNREGVVDKGYEIFNMMTKDYNLEPSHEHYSCMVDMLGRAGRLKEAEELMSEVPGGPGESMLQSMLGSCRLHGEVTMGAKVAELAMKLKPELSGSYVQMYNIYAEKEEWERAAEIRKTMRKKNVSKEVGFSWIDVSDSEGSLTMQGFSSGDKSHLKSDEIYKMVQFIVLEMNLEGTIQSFKRL